MEKCPGFLEKMPKGFFYDCLRYINQRHRDAYIQLLLLLIPELSVSPENGHGSEWLDGHSVA
ncbi:hypothetical protein KIN20_026434 [Parelaphostrongylus tenuis]|uniref:Uncharacterized protein n=1 Tax=Parelaphostrongylus tenuis TaxID=148309 RepID=A0AAD5WD20_PARTN|nr:hypothetical protein KIN20_026434 [Parelaphostrongylus tenuis]